ncbi:peroxisomal sarcosine oxidase [Eucyclogobius newberryi]|uniref:peroxisomal sarcosine oxidase n=1 Tax=Eucyclogobius newberryi TaxID=166745 RepID=UPI003B5A5478
MSTSRESDLYDCIVIGAGVQGSFTAYSLSKRGQRTLLLEQFVLPHTRGSSHGQSRIIRKAYEQDFYTRMMEECYGLWAELEREGGVTLYRQTGLLVMGPEHSDSFTQMKSTLLQSEVPTVSLTPEDFSSHVPQMLLVPGDGAIVDVTAGVLYADRALRTAQDMFKKFGGVVRDQEKVVDITPGPVVTVTTSARSYRARSVVITAGPWANRLLAPTGLQLPLEVVKINVCYWKEKTPGTYNVKNRFPCFLLTEGEQGEDHIYGLPSNEYPGLVKICLHTGSPTDPDHRDRQTDRSDVDILSRFVSRCVPGLEPEPAIVESCMYTLTPDSHFVLDFHPRHRNIVIGAGFSGHGFKFGPLIGKILCELSLGEVPTHDLSPFRIRRFQGQTRSAL